MRFPVFPLNGAILFPGTNLPLNIFEKKYLKMVDYALSKNRTIGMIQKNENNSFFKIGCLGKITKFTETEDGRYEINLLGLSRFYFKKTTQDDFEFIIIDGEIIKQKNVTINRKYTNKKLLESFKNYLSFKKINFNVSGFEGLDSIGLAKIICVISPLDYLIKQMLLEFNNDEDLYKNLLSALEFEMQKTENLKVN
jgi:hypothetical protein